MTSGFLERAWNGDDAGTVAVRTALMPLSWLYGAAVGMRNLAYDRGGFGARPLGLPTVSVGNLTVGGTGKTPVAAWLAGRLSALGGRPGILLRGYGGDEPDVHRRLVPGAIVVPSADRVLAAGRARAMGATALILDDAFQHRQVARDADVVLLSADRAGRARLLPAGPYREPLTSLRRATHIVVTRKAASAERAGEVAAAARRMAPQAEVGVIHLAADALVPWSGGASRPLSWLGGHSTLAVAGIGDPATFLGQLHAHGGRVRFRPFADHHAFSAADVAALAQEAGAYDLFLCTLKDAVKLGPVWPSSAPPIWYLSQRVNVEIGAEMFDRLARRLTTPMTPTPDISRRQLPAKDPTA